MEKKIILTMQPSKDIDIVLNEHDGITIGKENRIVKAEDIYNLLKYERGDVYTVESVNVQNLDVPVLKFFTELFCDITERLNRLSESQSGDEDEEYEEHTDKNGFEHSSEDDEELPL